MILIQKIIILMNQNLILIQVVQQLHLIQILIIIYKIIKINKFNIRTIILLDNNNLHEQNQVFYVGQVVEENQLNV